MNIKNGKGNNRWLIIAAFASAIPLMVFVLLAADAEDPIAAFFGILSVILMLAGVGFGAGSMGIMVNNLFSRRAEISYRVFRLKPWWSLVTGIVITLLGLGLFAILAEAIPFFAILIALAYTLGVGIFGIGSATRYVAQLLEPPPLEDDLPGGWAHIKGGVVLLALNVVFILGSILMFGILLSGIGAALLGYFAGMGRAVADVSSAGMTPPVDKPAIE